MRFYAPSGRSASTLDPASSDSSSCKRRGPEGRAARWGQLSDCINKQADFSIVSDTSELQNELLSLLYSMGSIPGNCNDGLGK